MNLLITRLIVLGTALLSPDLCSADEATTSKKLSDVTLFAFGGIGVAGTTSPGEIAFRDVLKTQTAADQFVAVLRQGGPAGQCYALVGLRLKNRALFDAQVKSFSGSKVEVQTASGCMMMKLPMSSVVAGIRSGNYDEAAQRKVTPVTQTHR